jgi:hypothetical protein
MMVAAGKNQRTEPRFSLGQQVATPGAIWAMEMAGQNPMDLLCRHHSGDWGDVCPEDAQVNERSVAQGFRIMSVYRLTDGKTVWVITEADRSITTILLPDEY